MRTRPRPTAPAALDRYHETDRYRAEREWARYEGTGQRDLWRELRERFLHRHSAPARWALDLGSGPGRFTFGLGDESTRKVALDVSREMLRSGRRHQELLAKGPAPRWVRGDGRAPPFPPAAFGSVALLGNSLGFAGASADRLRDAAMALVAPGGTLVVEVAPGPGERSRYLTRLPETAMVRFLRAPVAVIVRRVMREGFDRIPYRRETNGEFRRISAEELSRFLVAHGWQVLEGLAVAPALGPLAARVEAARADPKAWDHLLQVEEELGRQPARWDAAAAVVVAARRRPV